MLYILIILAGLIIAGNWRSILVLIEPEADDSTILHDSLVHEELQVLETFDYYTKLSPVNKQKFRHRVEVLYKHKTIVGVSGFTVTTPIKIKICAVWAQVTFGLDNFLFDSFSEIAVTESTFYSRLVRQEVKGLVIPQMGRIYLSWADTEDGINTANDSLNLAIHEIAHAVYVATDYPESDYVDFNKSLYSWLAFNEDVFEDLKQGKITYLREYGATNEAEFFAVCLETFFEEPEKLKTCNFELFNSLCILLNQNPLNINASITTPSKSYYERAARAVKYATVKNSSSTYTKLPKSIVNIINFKIFDYVDLALIFFSFVALFMINQVVYMFSITLISIDTLSIYVAFLSVLGILVYNVKHKLIKQYKHTTGYILWIVLLPFVIVSYMLILNDLSEQKTDYRFVNIARSKDALVLIYNSKVVPVSYYKYDNLNNKIKEIVLLADENPEDKRVVEKKIYN